MSKILEIFKTIPEPRLRDLADIFGVLLSKPASYWQRPHGQRRLARLFLARGERSLFDRQIAEFLDGPQQASATKQLIVQATHEVKAILTIASRKVSAAWQAVAKNLEAGFKIEIDGLLAGAGSRELQAPDSPLPISPGQRVKKTSEDKKLWEWPEEGETIEFGLRVVALGHPEDRELVLKATIGPESLPGLVFCVRHDEQVVSAKFDPVRREACLRIPRPGWRGWSKLQFSLEMEST